MFLTAWCRPKCWVVTNDDVAKFVKFNPKRFIGVATVDLEDPVEAVKELERAVMELGFKAFRVVQWLWNLPPNHKLFYPLFVKCVELDIPFCCQVGHTGPLMPSETGRPIPYIDEIAITFPKLKIVCGHIGYPWTEEMIAVAWKHKNVYIDTSAYDPKYYPAELLRFMSTNGKTKVLFGTNFPMACAENAKKLKLKPETLELFLHGNAERLFKLEVAAKL